MQIIQHVPTNIITGFLGVGKTTAILQLLKQKPDGEKWAVLVNEFGEIGVDGDLIEGNQSNNQEVFIGEVPGGCMCCASNVPMQIALNQLLKKARPDRLLIEPTGLGHPKEVLKILRGPQYQNVLDLKATLTLVDARHFSDERYTSNEIFIEQLEQADMLVANKSDLYAPTDMTILESYLQHQFSLNDKQLYCVSNGTLDLAWLNQSSPDKVKTVSSITRVGRHRPSIQLTDTDVQPVEFPPCGYISQTNHTPGFSSVGWQFSPDKHFIHNEILRLFSSLKVERIKAVLPTDLGLMSYNKAKETLSCDPLQNIKRSIIEIIDTQIDDNWQDEILSCIARQT